MDLAAAAPPGVLTTMTRRGVNSHEPGGKTIIARGEYSSVRSRRGVARLRVPLPEWRRCRRGLEGCRGVDAEPDPNHGEPSEPGGGVLSGPHHALLRDVPVRRHGHQWTMRDGVVSALGVRSTWVDSGCSCATGLLSLRAANWMTTKHQRHFQFDLHRFLAIL